MAEHWYSYECLNGCSPPTGVILDLRLPSNDKDAPTVRCPICGSQMHFRGRWAATEGGFGASGDHPDFAEEAVDSWITATTARWEKALLPNPPDSEALHDMPPLPGNVSCGGFIEALRRRRH